VPEYLLLLAPSSNRVYAGDAPRIAAAEVEVLAAPDPATRFLGAGAVNIAGVPYLSVTTDGPLDPALLGRLSGAYACFVRGGAGEDDLLRPVTLERPERYDDDLLTIPKYPGKTNEQLTRTLLNLTLATTAWSKEAGTRRFSILDPLAGRGTTLSSALLLGHDAVGVEVERREVDAYATFLRTWLRRKRLKHTIDLRPLRRRGVHLGEVMEVEVAPDKEAHRSGGRQSLTLYACDTLRTAELVERRRFDAIVTDAPYGIAHGSRSAGGRNRSPAELLGAAVPIWASVLRTGGALGIAWNTHGLARDELAQMCSSAGLQVCSTGPYLRLAHRVDAGIHRDLLIARKLGPGANAGA
jgi:hypothetical protein